MASDRVFGVGELGRRLALAFVFVALTGIIVLAGISAATTGADTARLVKRQEGLVTHAIALGAAAAYGPSGWRRASVDQILDVASSVHASARVRNNAGMVISSTEEPGTSFRGPALRAPVVAGGRRVGSVIVWFDGKGLGAAVGSFEASQWRARIFASGIATLIALVVGLVIARLITAPIEMILQAMRARGAGDRGVRITQVRGVGVLRELLEGFNESTDALDKKDRLQRNLVADVAHEVRTPVAILQAGHEAMLDGVTKPTPENLASLRDEVLRLARMVDDLQRLAAAEAAALQLKRSPHDLAAIAAQAAGSLAEAFSGADVDLVQRLTQVPVLCDPDRIREVITNLLTNALKFTPAGGSVLLETGPDGANHLARLRVSDTGIGIPAQDLPHVTERFFRSRSSADMAAGSGIGLTIVTELIRAHHGELEIASESADGTQVTVTFPITGDWHRT